MANVVRIPIRKCKWEEKIILIIIFILSSLACDCRLSNESGAVVGLWNKMSKVQHVKKAAKCISFEVRAAVCEKAEAHRNMNIAYSRTNNCFHWPCQFMQTMTTTIRRTNFVVGAFAHVSMGDTGTEKKTTATAATQYIPTSVTMYMAHKGQRERTIPHIVVHGDATSDCSVALCQVIAWAEYKHIMYFVPHEQFACAALLHK